MVDGKFRLSAVVTNDYSDWSTQDYPCGQLGLRLYRFGASFVVSCITIGIKHAQCTLDHMVPFATYVVHVHKVALCGQDNSMLTFQIETFSQTTGKADFIRICHLNIKDDEPVCAGIFACAPLHADSKVVFDQLTFAECKEYPHKAL